MMIDSSVPPPVPSPVLPSGAARASALWKGLATLVIAACLGVQILAIVRPQNERLYPFIDYPMYARSSQPGKVYRTRGLWAETCEAGPRAWRVEPEVLGYQPYPLRDRLAAIVSGRPSAAHYQAELGRAARARLTPRPCALTVRERAVALTPAGVDPEAFTHPRWTVRATWRIDAAAEGTAR